MSHRIINLIKDYHHQFLNKLRKLIYIIFYNRNGIIAVCDSVSENKQFIQALPQSRVNIT